MARQRATPESLRVLARQGLRWATAARQDREPAIAMLHANYARAASDHLRQVASDREIFAATGLDPIELERAVTRLQDDAMRALALRCPAIAPPQIVPTVSALAAIELRRKPNPWLVALLLPGIPPL